MATCPNCGEIIMEGDPYCSHCGAHLQWNERDNSSKPKNDRFSLDEILNQMSLFGRKREILKDKVKEFLSNRYCRNLKVRSYYNMYVFEFTRENLINIAGRKFHEASRNLRCDEFVDLVKELQNIHDPNAIRVEFNGETVGYVGNSPQTVPEGIKSASDIQNTFTDKIKARILFWYLDYYLIAKLII